MAAADADGWETVSSNEDEATSGSAVYQFKIILKHLKPPIWRRILILNNSTFAELHSAVVGSMGWLDLHLHTFHARDKEIAPVNEKNDSSDISRLIMLMTGQCVVNETKLDETKVKLFEHFKKPKDKILYVYDLDDGWEHSIVLERILPYDSRPYYPICIAGERACPPDDCGGIDSYEKLLKILSDPNNPEHGDVKAWMNLKSNETYDSEAFDPITVRFVR